ncbi:hypothetical protein [Nocardia cyriacigeorgica]|uniref:Uncharacterized protein n=1 Tax=Nocardia cyriacigeorgica TaxID=135487 RepID=A0A5R8NM94_9NOCA|nr:hypothetical protein [Nocardia cyriacigeorgica]TLF76731.1 hypothetical protein FEK34_17710 [Nocardia cyriacigeorgica]
MFGLRGAARIAAIIAITIGVLAGAGFAPAAAEYGGVLAIDEVTFVHSPDAADDSGGTLDVTVTYSCADGEADSLHVYAYQGTQSPSDTPVGAPHGPGYDYDIICDSVSRRKTVAIDPPWHGTGSDSRHFTNGAQGRVTAELRRGTTTTRHATGCFEWNDPTARR